MPALFGTRRAAVLGAVSRLVRPTLPPISQPQFAVLGGQLLASGYAGPLYQARRASDAATMDVYATRGVVPDYAALMAWGGGSAITIPIIYDQSGNGRNLVQATVANQPSLDPAFLTNGVAPILIDGNPLTAPYSVVAKNPAIAGLTLDLIANSVFMTATPLPTFRDTAYFTFSSADGLTAVEEFFSSSQLLYTRSGGANESTVAATQGPAPRAVINTFGRTCAAGQSVLYVNGVSKTTTHTRTTANMPLLTLGQSITGGANYNGRYKLFGMVVYAAALSAPDSATIVAGLDASFGVTNAYDYRVVFDGDSIQQGIGSTLLRNMENQLIPTLSRRADIRNLGVPGELLASLYAGRSRYDPHYTAAVPCLFFEEGGTNDLAGTTAAATLYTTLTNQVAYVKGLGFKVAVCTLLPRNDASWSGTKETRRTDYNTLVRANAAGADLVLDLASDPVMGAAGAADNAALYVDKLHPTSLGYSYLAPLYKAAMELMLGSPA